MDFSWMCVTVFVFIMGLVCMFAGEDGIAIGIFLCVASGFALFFGIRKNKKISNISQQTDIKVLGDNNIELKNRTSNNARLLSVQPYRDVSIHHRPAELVYTSATVGGVTTGGFHVNPEENTALLGGKTGTYYILFCDYNDSGRIVKNIRIQPEMVESIKDNPTVCQFMDKYGRWLELEHKTSDAPPAEIVKAAQEYQKQGRWDLGAKLLQPYTIKTQLSKEECEAVITWMCGN